MKQKDFNSLSVGDIVYIIGRSKYHGHQARILGLSDRRATVEILPDGKVKHYNFASLQIVTEAFKVTNGDEKGFRETMKDELAKTKKSVAGPVILELGEVLVLIKNKDVENVYAIMPDDGGLIIKPVKTMCVGWLISPKTTFMKIVNY